MAKSIAMQLLEMPMDTGEYPNLMPPDKQTRLRSGQHPYGKHPGMPDRPEPPSVNYSELLASKQYRDSFGKLAQYYQRVTNRPLRFPNDLPHAIQMALRSVGTIKELERSHRPQLAQTAINLVLDMPAFRLFRAPYESGEIAIEARIVDKVDLSGAQMGKMLPPEEEEEEQSEDSETQKRLMINAFVQGAALANNYSFHMVQDQLNQIDPTLVNLYGFLMAFSEIGYLIAPEGADEQAASMEGEQQAGVARVVWDEENNRPKIIAQGTTFPFLVQELSKGLMELVSRKGLPSDQEKMKGAIEKADLVTNETWAMILGRRIWMDFVEQVGDEDELTVNLYDKIIQMEPDEYHATIKTLLAGGSQAGELMQQMVHEIKVDMELEDSDEFKRSESGGEPEGPEFGGPSEFEPPDPEAWRGGESVKKTVDDLLNG
jgi:hypothetical protein